jgi:PAS domain S-box-containing protein
MVGRGFSVSVSVDLEDCVFVEDLAEPVLQSKVMRYHARLLEIMGQAVVAVDPNGKIAFWNEAAARLFGCAPSQMVGKRIREAFKDVIFENADAISKHMNRHEGWTGEATVKLSNGDRIATILSNKPIVNNGKYCGMVGVFTDVSNLKWMQEVLEEANEAVVQLNEKLRVVDSLTRHDLRNKLTTVNASVYVLKKRAQENKAALELLLEIEKVSKQMAQILEFQQYYVQVGMEELRNVDIEVYVREAAELFSDLKGIQLINNCHGLTLLADSLLRQLLYNLIDNTLKYGEKTSHIAVRFEKHKARLLLIYEDDGVGIADDVKGLLFTEGYGKGTGYGLYLIRRICENYGWTIEETGVAGKGAQFTMTVPEGSVNGKHRYYIC